MNNIKVLDFHSHAFPDFLAARAMAKLTAADPECIAYHDGTLRGLIASMDNAGIDAGVIASIATAPHQVRPILEWSRTIMSERIIPFVSLHRDSPDNERVLDEAKEAGIRGVKIHNLYQGFDIDDARMLPFYEAVAEREMALLFHSGKDPAYVECESASPSRIRRVHEKVPGLKIVAGHFGGWRMWEQVLEVLAGEDLYIEVSMSLGDISEELWWAIFNRHSKDRLLFGSDSPWADQKSYLEHFRKLDMPEDVRGRILSGNGLKLLGLM